MEVVFREQALADLEEISGHISERDTSAASRVVKRIHSAIFGTIARLPLCGRLDPGTGCREFPVPGLPYIIIYMPKNDILDIIGVFHTSRNPQDNPQP